MAAAELFSGSGSATSTGARSKGLRSGGTQRPWGRELTLLMTCCGCGSRIRNLKQLDLGKVY